MPEVTFTVRLPDGSYRYCYSPSTVVKSYFEKGEIITASDFLPKARKALTEASERVVAKFGYACTAASASISDIEDWAGSLPPEALLTILHI